MPSTPISTTLILGIGNLLLGDEGLGVHAAHRLMQATLPEGVRVLEIGTAILDALPDIAAAGRIIVIDAMQADGKPGTVYKIPHAQCQSAPCIGSMHGIDLRRVLALAGRADTPEIMAFGIEPAFIGWSMTLSAEVEKSLPRLIEAVSTEIGQFCCAPSDIQRSKAL